MKIKIDDNISFYQMKELLKVIIKKLNLEIEEKDIPGNIKKHFIK